MLDMDIIDLAPDLLSLASVILVLLLNTNRSLSCLEDATAHVDSDADALQVLPQESTSGTAHMDAITRAALHHWRLFNTLAVIDEDLGFWVKPRSTAWFTRFMLHEYDDARWIQMFRFTKQSVFSLAQHLSFYVKKKDTKYRAAVPVTVRVACTLFKLCHGATLLLCSELFAVGRSTVSIMLREVVQAINVGLRNEISWPYGEGIAETEGGFRNLCGLPGVMGAIDGTHFTIGKPRHGSADYYYFKAGAYTVNCQAVVDSSKKFLDLYVGMPGSTNDARVLRRSSLFHRGQRNSLWEGNPTFSGFSPYLLGDSGYPILPWIMVPHRRSGRLPMADALFNRRLSRGRAVVENAFGLLKQTFRELHQKTDLHVAFVPDVVTCCAILHNILLNQSHEEIERLLEVLCGEGGPSRAAEVVEARLENGDGDAEDDNNDEGHGKRRDLGVFLSLQRLQPFA